jgi:5-methylcytosine-specific restriction endonuclease McrA
MPRVKLFDNSPRACNNCSISYTPTRHWQKACSYKCSYSFRNSQKKLGVTNFGKCARCAKSLENKFANAIYCSKTCKSMDHNFKHRAKTRTPSVPRRLAIYQRDLGKCYMCQTNLPLGVIELDHLVPVSRLGSSDSTNLAVSCQACNRARGTKIGIQQLTKLYELRT